MKVELTTGGWVINGTTLIPYKLDVCYNKYPITQKDNKQN